MADDNKSGGKAKKVAMIALYIVLAIVIICVLGWLIMIIVGHIKGGAAAEGGKMVESAAEHESKGAQLSPSLDGARKARVPSDSAFNLINKPEGTVN